jgi:hypothetical protein
LRIHCLSVQRWHCFRCVGRPFEAEKNAQSPSPAGGSIGLSEAERNHEVGEGAGELGRHADNKRVVTARRYLNQRAICRLHAPSIAKVVPNRQQKDNVVRRPKATPQLPFVADIDDIEAVFYRNTYEDSTRHPDRRPVNVQTMDRPGFLLADFVSYDSHVAADIQDGPASKVDPRFKQIGDSVFPGA